MTRLALIKKLERVNSVEQAISLFANLQQSGVVENVRFQTIGDDIDVDLYLSGGEILSIYNLLTDRIISL